MIKKKIIVANWKMNPKTPREAVALWDAVRRTARNLPRVDVAVCPPAVFLGLFSSPGRGNVFIGAQDVFWEQGGAYTGQIAAAQMAACGARFTIVGHSERRALGETDEQVSLKTRAALKAGLTPIVCVGEMTRDSAGAFFGVLTAQLQASLDLIPRTAASSLVIAYEPLWAIGRNFREAMDSQTIHETIIFIRKVFADKFGQEAAKRVRIIYGGAVESKNIAAIMSDGRADGVLVGHKSLVVSDFTNMLKSANAV